VDRLNSMIADDFLRIEHGIVRDHGGIPRAGRRMRHSSYVIELRVLTPGDWAVWRGLRLAALAEAPRAFRSRLADWVGEGDRAERWRARLSIPGSFNVVAVLDGEPAGMASGVPADDGIAELISLWVSPAARGRGVGDQLMQAVERWARQEGMAMLRLAVVQGNANAAALYIRNGFALTGELGDPMPDGVPQNIMAKGLRRG
jgi:ribosomal protein S18 acetylase RimI-like enzyme